MWNPALAGQRRQRAKDETSDTRLAAFIEATEVTENTTLLEADRLTAFRTFFTHKAVFRFVISFNGITGNIPSVQHPRNGVRDGQYQSAVLKDRMLTADTFKLVDDLIHFYTRS